MPTYPKDFDYGNDIENEKELQRFLKGELSNILVSVVADVPQLLPQIFSHEVLGDCFVSTTNIQADIEAIIADHDMIQTAVDDLSKQLTELAKKFNNK